MSAQAEPESKTQLLRQLYKDVVQLKKDLEPLQQTSLWIKNNFKQTLDGVKGTLIILIYSQWMLTMGFSMLRHFGIRNGQAQDRVGAGITVFKEYNCVD